MRTLRAAGAAFCILAFAGVSCSSDSSSAAGSTGSAGGGIAVTLQEFSIVPATASTAAGMVTFDVSNTGPDETHEFVVVKTDLAADALPTKADGSVNEEGADLSPVDEVEDVTVGTSTSLTVDLAPGNYVFICNILNEDTGAAHYHEGMRVAFIVT